MPSDISNRWDHRTYLLLKKTARTDNRITRAAGFLGTTSECRQSLDGELFLLRYDEGSVPTFVTELVENHRDGVRAAFLTHAQAISLVQSSAWQQNPEPTPPRSR